MEKNNKKHLDLDRKKSKGKKCISVLYTIHVLIKYK
jgi:hypothetical protein